MDHRRASHIGWIGVDAGGCARAEEARRALVPGAAHLTFAKVEDGVSEIRDFQTTGVVSFARGCPFYALQAGRLNIMGQRVSVKEDYRMNCVRAMNDLVAEL